MVKSSRVSTLFSYLRPEILILLAAWLAFGRTVGADYLRWDDRDHIFENVVMKEGMFKYYWFKSYYDLYIPVIYNVWTLIWLATKEAWAFHFFNVFFHSINCVLVYKIALRWTEQKAWPAFFGTLIFAIHPLQTETVAWISAGRDVLAATLGLLALLVLENQPPTAQKPKTEIWRIVGSALLFALSLLCKPTMAPLPGAMLLANWIMKNKNNAERKAEILRYGLWFVGSLGAIYITQQIQGRSTEVRVPLMTIWQCVIVGLDSMGFYLQKTFAPFSLSAEYGRKPLYVLDNDLFLLTIGILFVFSAVLVLFKNRLSREFWAGLVIAFVMASPTLGFIRFQAQFNTTVADRYMYMPMLGFAFSLAALVHLYPKIRYGVLALAVAWTGLSFARAGVYDRDETFYMDILRTNPKNFNATLAMGVVRLREANYFEAERWLKESVVLDPFHVTAANALAAHYYILGQYDKILTDIEPKAMTREFLAYNVLETKHTAAIFRVFALTHHRKFNWYKAYEYYCRYFQLDPSNQVVLMEFNAFAREMMSIKGNTLPNCPYVKPDRPRDEVPL